MRICGAEFKLPMQGNGRFAQMTADFLAGNRRGFVRFQGDQPLPLVKIVHLRMIRLRNRRRVAPRMFRIKHQIIQRGTIVVFPADCSVGVHLSRYVVHARRRSIVYGIRGRGAHSVRPPIRPVPRVFGQIFYLLHPREKFVQRRKFQFYFLVLRVISVDKFQYFQGRGRIVRHVPADRNGNEIVFVALR